MLCQYQKKKQGKWVLQGILLWTDTKADTVTFVNDNGRNIFIAGEDTRLAIIEDRFTAAEIQSSDASDDLIINMTTGIKMMHDCLPAQAIRCALRC